MNLPTFSERITAFSLLGEKLRHLPEATLEDWCKKAHAHNPWFDDFHVKTALQSLGKMLEKNKIEAWASRYTLPQNTPLPQKVGVIMAGNIPAVGFQDFFYVLASGHLLYAKTASVDTFLIKAISDLLIEIQPKFQHQIFWADMLKDVDAIIATGSDNSARYFEYYFRHKPHIIRQNRVSVAVLNGEENQNSLELLTQDILLYYGLGCRNIAKMYIPKHFSMKLFLDASTPISKRYIQHYKYANNYDYNKSIYLVNRIPHLDNGYLIAVETHQLVSPISVIYYQYYENIETLTQELAQQQAKIQCITSDNGWYQRSIPFGTTQSPTLSDYADNIDVMQFCLNLG